MENLAKREKILIAVGFIFIVIYVSFKFFLQPSYVNIKKESQNMDNKKAQYASIEKLKAKNITDSIKLDAIKYKFEDSIKALPKNERNPEISYNLNVLATKNNIKLNSVSFNTSSIFTSKASVSQSNGLQTNTSQKLMVVPVTVVINGDYNTTLNFIQSIEKDSRLSEIVSVNTSLRSDLKNVLQSNIVLNYYYSEGNKEDKPTYNIKDKNAGKSNLFN